MNNLAKPPDELEATRRSVPIRLEYRHDLRYIHARPACRQHSRGVHTCGILLRSEDS